MRSSSWLRSVAIAGTVTAAVLDVYGPQGFWYAVVAWSVVVVLWVWVLWTSPQRQRLRRPAQRLLDGLGLTELDREGSTGIYRTEDEVRELHDFPAARLASDRREFVKNELGSYNSTERAAFRIVRTMGRVTEQIWRVTLARDGFELTNAVINKLETLITRDFRGEYFIKEELKPDIDRVLDGPSGS